MKTLKELLSAVAANLKAQQEALAKLPETLRASLQEFDSALTAQLAKVPALETAMEKDAVEFLSGLVTELNAQHTRVMGQLGAFATVQTELNGLKEAIAKGEYVPKAKVEEAVMLAREDARKALQAEIVATRKSVLETAGLPVPGEAVLALTAEEFAARQKQATENVKAIQGRTGNAEAQKALTNKYAWLPKSEFDGEMQTIAVLLGAGPAKQPDPTLGAAGGQAKPEGGAKLEII